MTKTIFIPNNPNIDAVSTAFAVCFVETLSVDNIKLVPAIWTGEEMSSEDICIGLNAPEAKKEQAVRYGRNDENKMVSCLSNYLEGLNNLGQLEYLDSLSSYIDNSLTNKGAWANNPKGGQFSPYLVDVGCVFDSFKFQIRKIDPDDSDMSLIDTWFEFLSGYIGKQNISRVAKNLAEEIEIQKIDEVSIACVEDNGTVKAQDISRFLFSRGVNVIIYKENNHIGVLRSRRSNFPDLTDLKDLIDEDGWYFYPKGTMASRGSRSKPVEGDSKYNTVDLLEMVKTIIENSKVAL